MRTNNNTREAFFQLIHKQGLKENDQRNTVSETLLQSAIYIYIYIYIYSYSNWATIRGVLGHDIRNEASSKQDSNGTGATTRR